MQVIDGMSIRFLVAGGQEVLHIELAIATSASVFQEILHIVELLAVQQMPAIAGD